MPRDFFATGGSQTTDAQADDITAQMKAEWGAQNPHRFVPARTLRLRERTARHRGLEHRLLRRIHQVRRRSAMPCRRARFVTLFP